jgi:ATP-dependent helicase YprA (DUF1998 family)
MRRSPYLIAEELKETLCIYLETAYKVAHPAIRAERARLLRQPGVISQQPYIETTPRFQAGAFLKDLALPTIPSELPEFASLGLPIGRYPLYKHQEDALRAAWDETGKPSNLVVASGTGSGKTEIFYLTILADILRTISKRHG